jgi:hypothetical protein
MKTESDAGERPCDRRGQSLMEWLLRNAFEESLRILRDVANFHWRIGTQDVAEFVHL